MTTVLDQNLEKLFQRAYAPVRPREAFRRQLLQRLMNETCRTGSSVRHLRAWHVWAAAALVTVVASVAALLALQSQRQRSLQDILAEGAVAVRRAPAEAWVALPEEQRAAGLELDAFLEVATPRSVGVDVRAGEERLGLGATSHVRLASVERSARLLSGELTVESPRSAWQVRTSEGEIVLAHGTLAATYVGADASGLSAGRRCVEVALSSGSATAAGTALAEGERGTLCGGTFTSSGAGEPSLTGPATSGNERRGIPIPSEVESPTAQAPPTDANGTATLVVEVVAEEAARPVEAYRLFLLEQVAPPDKADPASREVESADGTFTWAGIRPGRYRLFAHADGYAVRQRHDLELAPGENRVRLELEVGATLRGFVVEQATGRPLADALVVSENDAPTQVLPLWWSELAESWAPAMPTIARTAADGSFTLPHVSTGTQFLRASHPEVGATWTQTFEVVAGTEPSPPMMIGVIEVPRGGDVTGRVEREDGSPWAGAVVVASAIDYSARRRCFSSAQTVVDADGRYAFRNLPSGPHIILLFGDGERRMSFTEVASAGRTVVDFVSESRGRIHGRLTDARGRPLAGYPVCAFPAAGVTDMPAWQATITDERGEYAFDGQPPGSYELHVSRPERMDKESVLRARVSVGAGETVERDLDLPDSRVFGRIVDEATGEPVPEAIVAAIGPHPVTGEQVYVAKQRSDADGSYVLHFLPPGTYDLVVLPYDDRHAARRSEAVHVPAGEEGVERDVALALGACVELRVEDEDGRPIQRATVGAVCGERKLDLGPFQMTNEQGFVRVSGLWRGTCTLVVEHPRFQTANLTVQVDTGSPSQRTVVLARSR